MVQAYCFSKYMGRLKVNVDKRGSMLPVNIFLYQDGFLYSNYFAERLVVPVEGAGISEAEVILLDHTVKQDEETLKMMEPYEYENTASAPFFQKKMIVLQTNLGSFWLLTTRPWAGPT